MLWTLLSPVLLSHQVKHEKYYLDILSMLQKKTKNNLNEYEQQMLINIISELKMTLLEVENSIISVNGKDLGTSSNIDKNN